MRRVRRSLRIAGLVAIVLAPVAVVAAADLGLTPEVLEQRAALLSQRAACLSNCKQLALAAIMYAQDYDETLPACASNDGDGTAHMFRRAYVNRQRADFDREIEQKFGPQYRDARWSCQLADVLMPYVKSLDIFNCPTLTELDARFKVETYVVGTDKHTHQPDAGDPVSPLFGHSRKVWQSGSYTYMCVHFPFDVGQRAVSWGRGYADAPGLGLFALWDVANLTGVIGRPDYLDPANPEDRMACGMPLTRFSRPDEEPLLMCSSLGVHEGYTVEEARICTLSPPAARLLKVSQNPDEPPFRVATNVGYVDGHCKYVSMGFDDFLKLTFSANSW